MTMYDMTVRAAPPTVPADTALYFLQIKNNIGIVPSGHIKQERKLTMKRFNKYACAVTAAFFSLSVAASAAPFGNKEDISFAKSLWSALEKAEFVGPDRINVRPFEGNEPHGAIQQVLGKTIKVGEKTGKVLVKVNHGGEKASIATVYDNPNKFLGAYTVMFKREAGYDTKNKDWFWAKYDKNGILAKNPKGLQLAGRVAKGAEKGCIFCHTAAGGEDLETLTER